MNQNLKRILVFRIGHLGDTIISLPAFWSIRDAFPDARIALLSDSNTKTPGHVAARAVLPDTGLFDEWIAYTASTGFPANLASYLKLLRTLRSGKFDAVFYLMTRNRDLSSIKRDTLFFKTAGIKNIYGADFLAANLLDPEKRKPLPIINRESDFFLEMLADSGVKPSKRGADMALTKSEHESAEHWLAKNCGSDFRSKKLIAVAPGSKWPSKVWKMEKYITVLKGLIEENDVFPIIFGGPEDRELGDRILKEIGCGGNTAGELRIRNGTAAIAHCRLYLGNDTGTMHMAAAAGTPCVAVFAATHFPGRWYPFGNENRIFRTRVECEGCNTPDCFSDFKCLAEIRPEPVLEACRQILAA